MIEMFTGKPGAGKSYALTREVTLTLPEGDWGVVGNLPLKLKELENFFLKPGRVWQDIKNRVRLISDEDTHEFWRFTPWFTVLPGGSAKNWKKYEEFLDYKRRGVKLNSFQLKTMEEMAVESVNVLSELALPFPPVLHIVDEAHIPFDSRKWDEMSDALTRFNSQHRKLKWRVIFATQFLGLIDKRVKGFAEKYHVFKNMFGARKWNFVEMPKRMREYVYTTEPTGNVGEPDEEHWWPLNPEVAECYDTSAGVGITGGKGAEKRGTRGFRLPWWSVFVGLAACVWLGSLLPGMIAGRVMGAFSHFTTAHPPDLQKKAGAQGVHPPAELKNDVRQNVAGVTPHGNASVTEPVYMLGSVVGRGVAKVYLSDGRVMRGKPGPWLADEFVRAPDGVTYWRKPSQSSANLVPIKKKT